MMHKIHHSSLLLKSRMRLALALPFSVLITTSTIRKPWCLKFFSSGLSILIDLDTSHSPIREPRWPILKIRSRHGGHASKSDEKVEPGKVPCLLSLKESHSKEWALFLEQKTFWFLTFWSRKREAPWGGVLLRGPITHAPALEQLHVSFTADA